MQTLFHLVTVLIPGQWKKLQEVALGTVPQVPWTFCLIMCGILKKKLILYLLLSAGWWHRSTKAVLLHALCSERKCWMETGWDFLVNCFPEVNLGWREPRFHCQGVLAGSPALGAVTPDHLCVSIRQSSPGFAWEGCMGTALNHQTDSKFKCLTESKTVS